MKDITNLAILIVLFFVVISSSLAQGQFQTIKQISAGQGYKITPLVGDYDGDGDMDILGTGSYVKNGTSGSATVLLRNNGEEFYVVDIQLPWFYSGGMYLWADIDNDNDLDIIAGGCGSYCYNSKELSIYRNDGADNFILISELQSGLTGGKLFSMVDYNNDGMIDIEIATQSENDGNVIEHTFYINLGNFTFEKTFELPVTTGEVVWGDLDNDGWKDFVLLNRVYKNLQNGTFQSFNSSATIPQGIKHFLFDADNDADLDIITSNGNLMINDGYGQFSFGSIILPFTFIRSLLFADFDGDGNKDMVVSGATSKGSGTQLFRAKGDGTFTPEVLNDQYIYSYEMAVADIDNDNDPDILLSGVFTEDVIILENGHVTELSKPNPPSNIQYSFNAETITFSWDSAADQESSSLEYNMYLMHGDNFKISPNADMETGASFIPGAANASSGITYQISTSVLPEGYYQWSIQSVDDELNTSYFASKQEFTLYKNNPSYAPTFLNQTDISDHSVSFIWKDNSDDETSFTLERSSSNGNSGFETIIQLEANTESYTDSMISPRQVYYYRIRLDGSSSLAYSNVIEIETKSIITTPPANTNAVALNSSSAKIEWKYIGSGITGFIIERSPDDKKHFTVVGSSTSEQLTYSDEQLESGRTYYYRLFAVNGDDFSDPSTITNVTLPLKEFNKITLASLEYESTYYMSAIAWGDYDNDGYDDLFLGYKAQLFHNKGNGTFEKITETSINVSESANDFVSVWGDYDNDGFLDLFYYTDLEKSSVYRGYGDGTFAKITTTINGDRSEIRNATWIDFDMDGDLDLSLTGGRYIYRYDGNDKFTRIDLPKGPSNYYHSSVASWADFDDDGDPDVFWGNYGKDEFFINNGDGSFTAITDQRITNDFNYDCCPNNTPIALWTDFNNDGKIDLSVYHAGTPVYLYVNHANVLDSAFYYYEENHEAWKDLFWTDYDCDGDLDLFSMGNYNGRTTILENIESKVFRKLKGGPLYDYVPSDANFSWNDFDNDGFSDLFQFDSDHQVYKNLLNGNNWIKIRLKGRASNSTGLGTKIFVKSDAGWQRSDVTTHHSFRIQQGYMSIFGVGKSTLIDSVKVLWPSGNSQYLTNIDINQVILIDEEYAQEKVTQAPSNLFAEVEFPSSITLKWTDRSEDETGFVIEMATNEGQFSEVGSVTKNINSFKIKSLIPGVKYKFRVRASNATNGRWTNTIESQIRLFTEVFGGDLTSFQSTAEGLAWGDPDNDGDPDLFLGSGTFEPDAIYYNENGIFTRHYLRNTTSYSRQAQWIDYNNDGYQDLHISVGGGILASSEYLNDFLYLNNGTGQLIEQTGHVLALDGYSDYTSAWGDINKDGFLDMIVPRNNGNSTIFLNLGGTLTPQQEPSGLSGLAEGMTLLSDLDSDRDLDVVVASSYGSLSSIYENINGQFAAVSNSGFFYSLSSFVLEDFNNDGTQDLLMVGQDQILRLFLCDYFTHLFMETPSVFPESVSGLRLSSGDFDNNGYIDVFVSGNSNSMSSRLFLNNGNLKFTSLTDPLLTKNILGTAIADFNKDGSLDVIALTMDDYDGKRYLLQGTKKENHWSRVNLKGVETNKFGIGARIRIFTGNTSQVRDVRSGSGGTFSDEQIAHFGLGSTTEIDYIKVEWPSGENQWIANPPIDIEMIVEKAASSGPETPASPSNLEAIFRSDWLIDLQWTDNSDNEKFFRIERAIGMDSFKPFKNVPANTTSYTDSIFVNFSEFQLDVKYRIVAVLYIDVESDPSNESQVSQIMSFENAKNSLIIYPQPASSKVFIRSENPIQTITIFGVSGQEIKTIFVNGLLETEVPLTHFTSGLYFLRITGDQGITMRKLFVNTDN